MIRPIKLSEEAAEKLIQKYKDDLLKCLHTAQVGFCPHMCVRLDGAILLARWLYLCMIPGALGENSGSTEGETSMEGVDTVVSMPDDDKIGTVTAKNELYS